MQQIALAEIVGLTVAAVALGLAGVEVAIDAPMDRIAFALFLGVAVSDLVLSRAVVPPAMVKQNAPRINLETAGYTIAGSAGIMAVGAVLVSGSGWLALPVGLIGIFNWLTVRMYLESLPYGMTGIEDR